MRTRHLSTWTGSIVAVATLFVGSAAVAQGLLPFQQQVIATNGDLVPGTSMGEVFGGSSTFDLIAVDDDGNGLFRGRFTGGTASATTDRAYFYGSSRSNLVMVIRSGDPEPTGSIPGATLNTGTGTGPGGSPRIAGNGIMMWGSALTGGGVTTTNDSVVYVGSLAGFAILIREGDPAVGTTGATYSSSFSSPSYQPTGLNTAGYFLLKSSLTGGDVSGTTNNEAWYTGSVFSGPVLMVRKNDAIGPGGETVSALGFISQLNASGQVLHDETYTVGSGVPAVTANDDKALFIYTPGGGNVQIAREGGATVIPGVTYAAGWTANTGSTTFNAAGKALINAPLGGAVTVGVDDAAVFLLSTGGDVVVERRGDAAPGCPGCTFNSVNNASQCLNDSDMVAFEASLNGAVTAANDTGMWAGTVGNLQLVMREGDIAPGGGGGVFDNINGLFMIMNPKGQIIFNVSIIGGSNPGSSLYCWDPNTGLTPLGLAAEMLEVQPAVFKAFGTIGGGVQFSNGDARPLSFNGNGDFIVRANMADGTGAIVRGHVGSLLGTPRSISVATGGVHSWYMNGGFSRAGQTHLIGGSVTGSIPGLTIGSINIPLNVDPYFNFVIANANVSPFTNTLGTLDASGRAAGSVTIPGGLPVLLGITLDHAWMGFAPSGALKFASEPASVTFGP